jgi:hypothetical protein
VQAVAATERTARTATTAVSEVQFWTERNATTGFEGFKSQFHDDHLHQSAVRTVYLSHKSIRTKRRNPRILGSNKSRGFETDVTIRTWGWL